MPPRVNLCLVRDTHLVPALIFLSDSHLHVWGDGEAPFPYAEGQEPAERLRGSSNPGALIAEMDQAGVGGALIVQPINYKFDHSYVLHAITSNPGR